MSVKQITAAAQKLSGKGYRNLNPGGYPCMVKMSQRGTLLCGCAVVFTKLGSVRIQACVDLAVLSEMIGLQQVAGAYPEIGGRGDRKARRRRFRAALRRMPKRFKRRVNNTARKIGQIKVLQKLRGAYAKVLESPAAAAGVSAAAKALQAFGVPEPVGKLALNQARFATADRAKAGGWAKMLEQASGTKGQRREMLRTVAKRQGTSLAKAVPTMLPGGGLKGGLAGNLQGSALPMEFIKKLGVSGLQIGADYQPKGYENAYLRGFYGV